jgi:hypothetical protein
VSRTHTVSVWINHRLPFHAVHARGAVAHMMSAFYQPAFKSIRLVAAFFFFIPMPSKENVVRGLLRAPSRHIANNSHKIRELRQTTACSGVEKPSAVCARAPRRGVPTVSKLGDHVHVQDVENFHAAWSVLFFSSLPIPLRLPLLQSTVSLISILLSALLHPALHPH